MTTNALRMDVKSEKRHVNRKRNKELKIRFSDDEYEQIKAKAGDKSIAEFMREYCLDAQNYEPARPIKYPKIDPKILLILAGATNNLNQIARGINQQNLQKRPLDLLTIYSRLALLFDILADIEKQLTYSKNANNEEQ